MYTELAIATAKKVSQFMQNHVAQKEQDFAIFSICDIWDYFEVMRGLNPTEMSFDQESRLILDFCETHNLYLYEKYKEEFFQYEGISYAKEKGYKGVILSNLS
jgi:hypothetical protein